MTSRRRLKRGRTLVEFLSLGVSLFVFLGLLEQVEGQVAPAEDKITALVDALTVASKDERREVIQSLARTGDARVSRVFELYRLGSLYRLEEEVVYYDETEEDDDFYEFALLLDPLSGEHLLDSENQARKVLIDDLEEVDVSRNERILIRSAEVLLRLSDQNVASRLAAVKRSGQPPRNIEAVPFLKELAVSDPEEVVRYTARESMLLIQFSEKV